MFEPADADGEMFDLVAEDYVEDRGGGFVAGGAQFFDGLRRGVEASGFERHGNHGEARGKIVSGA